MIEVKVEGLDELRERLLKLPKELRDKELRAAVSAAAKVVQDRAVENAPKDTGTLKRAIYRTRSKQASSNVQESWIIGWRAGKKYRGKQTKDGKVRADRDAYHGRFVEFGTSKMAAKPFMRPAFEATINEQIKAMSERILKGLERIAARLSGKK